METRINTFGEKEVKLQPKGLPSIWVKLYCDRCRKYQECLGFNVLSDAEWQEIDRIISKINLLLDSTKEVLKQKVHNYSRPTCQVRRIE